MSEPTRRWLLLLGLCVAAVLLFHSPVLAPVRLLVVTFHESGHALTALATGGSVVSMTVSLDEGGLTTTTGGSRFLILNGGYLGSLFIGLGVLIAARRSGAGARVSRGLGLLLVGAALLWFRPFLSFGFFYALFTGLALAALAPRLPAAATDLFARFLGVFSVLYALVDIKDDVFRYGLFGGSWYGDGPILTDAHRLAELTGLPSVLWGGGWLLLSLGVLFAARRLVV